MRGAAIADAHLGFNSFSDQTEGRNTREVDTETAWHRAIDIVVGWNPDLVTFAGDLFHHPRVSDYAKRAFLIGIRRLVEDTNAHIIIAQGNHDAGRTTSVLTPIALANLWDRVHIVTEPTRIRLQNVHETFVEGLDEKVSVACFPFVALNDGPDYKLDPDPEADVNVLLLHAAVKGSDQGDRLPYFYGSSDQALDIGREADRWDVVACGDFHEFTRLHESRLAFYSGSLERTSSNIWDEHEPKGVVLYDTASGEMEFAEVPNREMKDINFREFEETLNAEGLNIALACLADTTDPGPGWEMKDAIVRLKVEDFPKEERGHIDWAKVRQLKAYCTHFYLDVRYAKAEIESLGDRREKGGISLAEEADAFTKDDQEEVRDLFIRYLDLEAEVEDVEEVEP